MPLLTRNTFHFRAAFICTDQTPSGRYRTPSSFVSIGIYSMGGKRNRVKRFEIVAPRGSEEPENSAGVGGSFTRRLLRRMIPKMITPSRRP